MNQSEKVTPSQMLKEESEQGLIALSMYVAPKYKTPKHFHERFTEHFEVVEGNITFIAGKEQVILQLVGKISVPVAPFMLFKIMPIPQQS